MWRRFLLGVVLAGLSAGCSLEDSAGPGPHGGTLPALSEAIGAAGFSGKSAVLYGYAWRHCYAYAMRSATADPPGSSPPIMAITDRQYPLVMIGPVKPDDRAEVRAAKEGCAGAMVTAFRDARFTRMALICRAMAGWIPPSVTACKRIGGA